MTKISAILRADNGGLGTLSRMFAELLPGGCWRTVSIARHAGEACHERFGPANRAAGDGLTPELVEWLCDGADVLLSFECWYGAEVPMLAHARGVKTALVPMYECCPPAGSGLEQADLALCPSLLDLIEMHDRTPGLARAAKCFLPIPFDTTRIAFRRRELARRFVVHQGHGGLDGRNATQTVLDAWPLVRSPARLLVKRQPTAAPLKVPSDPRITVIEDDVPDYWELWAEGEERRGDGETRRRGEEGRGDADPEAGCPAGRRGDSAGHLRTPCGDVFLHPHRWDGLSLPIQEACAAGMPVMTTRYWPFCKAEGGRMKDESGRRKSISSFILPPSAFFHGWLPRSSQQMALEPERVTRGRICRTFDAHDVAPESIAAAVDRVYGQDIRRASDDVRAVAERWSWRRLGPVWRRLLKNLAEGNRANIHRSHRFTQITKGKSV